MAVGLSQHVKAVRKINIKVVVRQSPKSPEYTIDLIVNRKEIPGYMVDSNKENIIYSLQAALWWAQAFTGLLAEAPNEDTEKHYLNELREYIIRALALADLYTIIKD
jgi:hypothetical protein